jgi:DNA-binding NarL/FixJ family response regulator
VSTRVVIAEDQALLRQGIVRLLADAGFEVVAEAADAPDLLRKVAAHKPDVAIVDVQMPPDNTDDGLRAAMEIRATQPAVGVLVLSQYAEERYAVDLIGEDAAGVGYLLKDRVTDFKLFADAVTRVAGGGSVLDPTVVSHMLGRRRRDDPFEALTPREREVLELMVEGRSNKGIAEVLVVTPHAVEKHATSIFSKLGVASGAEDHRRVLAVLKYVRGESGRG